MPWNLLNNANGKRNHKSCDKARAQINHCQLVSAGQ